MSVKDLVGLYEAHPSTSSPRTTSRRSTTLSIGVKEGAGRQAVNVTPKSSSNICASPVDDQKVIRLAGPPSPSPARFIGHPLLRQTRNPFVSIPHHAPTHEPVMTTTAFTNTHVSSTETNYLLNTEDDHICDDPPTHISAAESNGKEPSTRRQRLDSWEESRSSIDSSAPKHYTSDTHYAMSSLRAGKSALPSLCSDSQATLCMSSESGKSPVSFDSDSPRTASTLSFTFKSDKARPTSNISQTRPSYVNSPVPATSVFAKDAPPLYLPSLDEYLTTLPAPSFAPVTSGIEHKDSKLDMFPPMDRLAATGKTIQDLETNTTIAPAWRNRNSYLSSLVSVALGATVSLSISADVSLYT